MSLQGKVFAITGGASGIGLATAKILAKREAIICLADVNIEALKVAEEYFSEQGVSCMTTQVDISKRVDVDSWIESIVQKHGRLDGAANVAGIIGRAHGTQAVTDLEDDEWHRIIAVNLTGTMYCLRAELRNIVDGGSIVNTASIHGIKGSGERFSCYPLGVVSQRAGFR
jgi:NAD(P)-dependent dehydrogenase (short-subunit alcohol dehydrogenase family)